MSAGLSQAVWPLFVGFAMRKAVQGEGASS
jgi:hypothetical protein